MAHSYVCNYYHCVFSTANRCRLITPDLKDRLWSYMGGIARANGVTARCVGGTDNHVHTLLSLPSTLAIAKAIQLIKGGSSKWVRDEMPNGKGFEWQEGYAALCPFGKPEKGKRLGRRPGGAVQSSRKGDAAG